MPAPRNEPVKLTKAYIDKVSPPAEGYEVHWDVMVKGYGLRVAPSGKRVFIATGRVKGKQITFTVGPYGELTEQEGREKARAVLQRTGGERAGPEMVGELALAASGTASRTVHCRTPPGVQGRASPRQRCSRGYAAQYQRKSQRW